MSRGRSTGFRGALLPLFLATAVGCGSGAPPMDEGTVAMVDGLRVTVGEVDEAYARLLREMDGSPPHDTAQATALKRAIVRELVDRKLLLAEAGRRHLSVSAAEIARERESITGAIPSVDLPETLGTAGMTTERLEAVLADDLLIRKLVVLLEAGITVGDAELADHYERNKAAFFQQEAVRARQIVVPTEREARNARRRIASGEDFGEVARQVSQSLDAGRGGDLGFFARGEMPVALEEAAFSLRPGELSPVIESPYGFHLLKVEEHRPARQPTLAEVREKVAARVREARREERYVGLLEELGKRADISYNPEHEKLVPDEKD